ncbi:MAG TPA: hypothetical protein VEO20_02380 [Thermoplasmata archaeon]|nr:hypothetical protein [Thermoplasmata archaeon]
MATVTEPVSVPPAPVETPGASILARIWKLLAQTWKFVIGSAPVEREEEVELTFTARIRKFLWLSSGLFSAASFAIPAIGYLAYGTIEGASTNFLAAVVSACLFGFASLLHFGPETA